MSNDSHSPGPGEWFETVVDEASDGQRLDRFLASQLADFSRVQIKRSIDDGTATVDGERAKPSLKIAAGQHVRVKLPTPKPAGAEPEAIPLDILYEDEFLAVVNKPPGMVTHPAKGHWAGTLASALMAHFQGNLSLVGGPTRPGIVHRLDRDTTGVILAAKDDRTHQALAEQFQRRTMQKEYFALLAGSLDRDRDRIDLPIGPHPTKRERMAIRRRDDQARPAVTEFEIVQRFRGFVAIKAFPKTGRTHQIRVHLAHAGAPVLCDKTYGGRSRLTLGELAQNPASGPAPPKDVDVDLVLLDRQALHAHRLTFEHPESGKAMTVEAPLPEDIERTLAALRHWRPL